MVNRLSEAKKVEGKKSTEGILLVVNKNICYLDGKKVIGEEQLCWWHAPLQPAYFWVKV